MSTSVQTQPTLKSSFTSRAATMVDLEVITDLFNDYWEPLLGVRKITLDETRSSMKTPGFDMDTSTRTVLSPEGQIVGFVMVQDLSSPPVHPGALGCVRADFEGHGIGVYLLKWAKERSRQAISRVPDGVRVSMRLDASSAHEPTRRLFEKLGLNVIRHSWLMMIDLDETLPAPKWPDGLLIHTFQDHADLRSVFDAAHEAFRDSWGYVEVQKEEAFERWQYRIENDKEFDPSLWFLVMDGDEIAAMALCDPVMGDDSETGFVNVLGVRRPWRRKGLALGLLHYVFGEFYRRDRKHVGLGVDTESLTGATRLYEKAGMHAVRQIDMYELELRPGKELSTQSIEN